MSPSSPFRIFVFIILFVSITPANAQKTVFLSSNGKKSFIEHNAIAKFEAKPQIADTFAIYASAKKGKKWEKSRHQFSVVKKSDSLYHILSNKSSNRNYRILKIVDTTEIGFVVEEYDEQKNTVFKGEALQVFPLLLHGQTTIFDKDGQPMLRIYYLMEKPMNEEMLFSPVDSSYKITRKPEFPGGLNAFQMEIARNISFPAGAQKTNTSGAVYIKFMIDKDGEMKNISPALDIPEKIAREGVKVIESIKKKWKPAESNGVKIPVWYYAKVSFFAY
jgi:hypothetical protein